MMLSFGHVYGLPSWSGVDIVVFAENPQGGCLWLYWSASLRVVIFAVLLAHQPTVSISCTRWSDCTCHLLPPVLVTQLNHVKLGCSWWWWYWGMRGALYYMICYRLWFFLLYRCHLVQTQKHIYVCTQYKVPVGAYIASFASVTINVDHISGNSWLWTKIEVIRKYMMSFHRLVQYIHLSGKNCCWSGVNLLCRTKSFSMMSWFV